MRTRTYIYVEEWPFSSRNQKKRNQNPPLFPTFPLLTSCTGKMRVLRVTTIIIMMTTLIMMIMLIMLIMTMAAMIARARMSNNRDAESTLSLCIYLRVGRRSKPYTFPSFPLFHLSLSFFHLATSCSNVPPHIYHVRVRYPVFQWTPCAAYGLRAISITITE